MIMICMQLLLHDNIEIKVGQIDHCIKIFKNIYIFDMCTFKSFKVCIEQTIKK